MTLITHHSCDLSMDLLTVTAELTNQLSGFNLLFISTIKYANIHTAGSEVGRLGGAELSVTFSIWISFKAETVQPSTSLTADEAADDGASSVLLPCLDGEAWKSGGESLP